MLETYTGLKTYDSQRSDPQLVSNTNIKIYCYCDDQVRLCLIYIYRVELSSLQAVHLEDDRQTVDRLTTFADKRVAPLCDTILVTALYNIVKHCLSRHSVRYTSAQVNNYKELECNILNPCWFH